MGRIIAGGPLFDCTATFQLRADEYRSLRVEAIYPSKKEARLHVCRKAIQSDIMQEMKDVQVERTPGAPLRPPSASGHIPPPKAGSVKPEHYAAIVGPVAYLNASLQAWRNDTNLVRYEFTVLPGSMLLIARLWLSSCLVQRCESMAAS